MLDPRISALEEDLDEVETSEDEEDEEEEKVMTFPEMTWRIRPQRVALQLPAYSVRNACRMVE